MPVQTRQRSLGGIWPGGAAVLLIFTALVIFLQYFPIHRVVQVWQPSWYETGEISMLTYVGSQEDQ